VSSANILPKRCYYKANNLEGRQRIKRRSSSVETVFGNIKHNLGFRRFNLKGLVAVNAELNLVCIAHNINKLFKTGLTLSQESMYTIKKHLAIMSKNNYFNFKTKYGFLLRNPFCNTLLGRG
jgi:Transposase DDE domain